MLATCDVYRAHRHASESPHPGSTPGLNPCKHLTRQACGPWRTHRHNTYIQARRLRRHEELMIHRIRRAAQDPVGEVIIELKAPRRWRRRRGRYGRERRRGSLAESVGTSPPLVDSSSVAPSEGEAKGHPDHRGEPGCLGVAEKPTVGPWRTHRHNKYIQPRRLWQHKGFMIRRTQRATRRRTEG